MPDTITSSDELKINTVFVDGDTRIITLKNPKATIERSEIIALSALIQNSQVLIGDKWGGAFGKIDNVKKVTTQRQKLDIA